MGSKGKSNRAADTWGRASNKSNSVGQAMEHFLEGWNSDREAELQITGWALEVARLALLPRESSYVAQPFISCERVLNNDEA